MPRSIPFMIADLKISAYRIFKFSILKTRTTV